MKNLGEVVLLGYAVLALIKPLRVQHVTTDMLTARYLNHGFGNCEAVGRSRGFGDNKRKQQGSSNYVNMATLLTHV